MKVRHFFNWMPKKEGREGIWKEEFLRIFVLNKSFQHWYGLMENAFCITTVSIHFKHRHTYIDHLLTNSHINQRRNQPTFHNHNTLIFHQISKTKSKNPLFWVLKQVPNLLVKEMNLITSSNMPCIAHWGRRMWVRWDVMNWGLNH